METEILKVKVAGAVSAAPAPSASGPEDFFFVFICRGSRAAYKKIEEFIRGKTGARLIFQRFSRNYLSVSEIKAERVFPAASVDWPDSLPGCFTYYGRPEWPNGPCELCKVRLLCKASASRESDKK